jgi:hypothetical protein
MALAIAGHTTEEGPLTDQVTLPLRHGGLGLSRTSPALGRAAYFAASAATHIAMRGGPEAFRPFDGPSGKVLRPQWEALHSKAGDLWKCELKEVNPERLGHIAEAQGVFALHEAQSRFNALYESYDVQQRARKKRVPAQLRLPPRLGLARHSPLHSGS